MLRWLEGFEAEQDSTEWTPKYSVVDEGGGGGFTFPAGFRSPAACTGGTTTANAELRTKALVASPSNTWFSGIRVLFGTNVTAGDKNAGYRYYSGATEQLAFVLSVNTILSALHPTASWKVYRGATLLGTSPAFFLDQNNYWEFGAVVRTSTNGSVTIRRNGTTFYSLSGVNTANSGSDGADRAGWKWHIGSQSVTVDDWYINDDAGSSNNTFMAASGDPVIFGKLPSGEGNRNDWTPSSGTNNAALVDDAAGSVSDADYVSSFTAGDDDLYDYTDFTEFGSSTPVLGVQLNTRGAMLASGSKVISPLFRDTGGSEDVGTSWTWSSTSAQHEERLYDLNPVTASAWTRASLNAGQFGVNLVS